MIDRFKYLQHNDQHQQRQAYRGAILIDTSTLDKVNSFVFQTSVEYMIFYTGPGTQTTKTQAKLCLVFRN